MTKPFHKIQWLLPGKVYGRARFETMLASLIAQVLSRRQHGALRWAPDSFAERRVTVGHSPPKGLGSGRWRIRAATGRWHATSRQRVLEEVRGLLDSLVAAQWGLVPRSSSPADELTHIAEVVDVASQCDPDFLGRLQREEFVAEVEAQARQRCPRAELVPVNGGGAWDGLPPDPDTETWHDLDRFGRPVAARWDAARRCWDLGVIDLFFHEAASVFAYIRPTDALKIIGAEERAGRWMSSDSVDIL